jgi:hypothetical protein
MQQFKIGEEGYKKFRKKWFATIVPLVAIIAVVIIVMNTLSSQNTEVNTLPIVLPVVLILIGFSLYRGLSQQKRLLESYSVTISDNEITREQLNTRPLSINFMEIKEIIKSEKGNFTIKGISRTDIIHIPYWIDNPAALEQRLETLAPITVNIKDPFYKKYAFLLTLLAMAAMVAVYAVTNKVIVGICGTLVTGLLIWSLYEIRTSKNVPEKTKRSSWVIIIVIASIMYATYVKLTGGLPAH